MAKTKYSYLYNGKVVRNSNRLYKFALVNEYNGVLTCSGTEQGALKEKVSHINFYKKGLNHCNDLLSKGITQHKLIGNVKEYKERLEIAIETINNEWHVVELEVREN